MGTNAVAPREAAGDFYDLARPVQSDPFRFSSVVRSGLGSGLAAGVYRGADVLREPTAASGRTRARQNHASARMRSAQYRLQATTTCVCACACACERACACKQTPRAASDSAAQTIRHIRPERVRLQDTWFARSSCVRAGSHHHAPCTAAHARHAEAMMRAWQHAYSKVRHGQTR
jgi:hypothetical protein